MEAHRRRAVTPQSIEVDIGRINPERKEAGALSKPTDDRRIGGTATDVKPFKHPSASECAPDFDYSTVKLDQRSSRIRTNYVTM
jgi:hypothetical protein